MQYNTIGMYVEHYYSLCAVGNYTILDEDKDLGKVGNENKKATPSVWLYYICGKGVCREKFGNTN